MNDSCVFVATAFKAGIYIATMSSRCESVESVMSVESVHLVREVLWDAMRTRHDWLGIFTALVQDYLSENFSRELLF